MVSTQFYYENFRCILRAMKTSNGESILREGFPEKTLGYITASAAPFSRATTLQSAVEFFTENPEHSVWPVEAEPGVIALLKRDTVLEKGISAPVKFQHKPAAEYSVPVRKVYNSRDNCQAAAARLTEEEMQTGTIIIFTGSSFVGIVSVTCLFKHVAELRTRELSCARELQEFLLDRTSVDRRSFDYRFLLKLSHEIGGDFYQTIQLNKNLAMIASFDVSGKNVSASLTTSMISSFFATLQELSSTENPAPPELLRLLNNVLCRTTPMDVFTAGIFYFIDTAHQEVCIYNFGYSRVFAIAYGDGERPRIAALAPLLQPLGIEPWSSNTDIEKGCKQLPVRKNLTLISYSDGLTDLENPSGSKFGEERVEFFVRKNYEFSPHKFIDELEKSLQEFSREAPQPDDITVLILKFQDHKDT